MTDLGTLSLHPLLLGISLPESPIASDTATQSELAACLSGLSPDWQLLAPFIKFDGTRYARHRLFASERWEALVLCWLPGQCTLAHDHGASWGISSPIFGTLTETQYRLAGEELPLEPIVTAHVMKGNVSIEAADTVHAVVNASELPAVSIHLYSPPLAHFTAYDVFTGSSWPVTPQW